MEREGWCFVAFVRLVPLFPFNLLNYALGLTRLSVQTFAVTSFITMTPGALAYAYLGDAGREAVSGGPDLVQKGLLALALFAAVALLPSLIRRWRRSGKLQPHQLQEQLSQAAPSLVLDVRNPDEFVGKRATLKRRCSSPCPSWTAGLMSFSPTVHGLSSPSETRRAARSERQSCCAGKDFNLSVYLPAA
ncbi:MAG TPA: VTT domain-containing protein [Candidatus Binatia bacterium]|nr:VTT domain-containing protein [Candidatus Binatia bacterium]